MKYWISKYALTQGIYEVDGEDVGDNMIRVDRGLCCSYYHKNDYCETEATARTAAEKMRTKKIASLRKQIERLERIEF